MHAAKQPPYSEGDEGAEIGLRFDCVAQRLFERARRLARAVRGLSIKILSSTGSLIRQAFSLPSRVARKLAQSFLHLAAEFAGGAFYAVFIHGRFSVLQSTRYSPPGSIVRGQEKPPPMAAKPRS